MDVKTGGGVEYRIRVSARARNLRLILSPRDGLTVVVPEGCDPRRIPAIVERRRPWIEGHLRRFAEAARLNGAEGAGAMGDMDGASGAGGRRRRAVLPESLELSCLQESWAIAYEKTRTNVVGVRVEAPGKLTVYGAVGDHAACREAIEGWLRLRTREELVPWLGRLADQNGLSFKEAFVRGQRTRWASCSAKGTINLSFKLLFLERAWVRCVLLHELCHTVHLNHSKRFWGLLTGLEPKSREIQKQMREAWRKLPDWVEER